jgi:hypothetical protein
MSTTPENVERAPYAFPMPADETELTRFMDDGEPDHLDEMHAQILAHYGEHAGTIMWDAAIADTRHGRAIRQASEYLTTSLDDARRALENAFRELARLSGGDAWHVEYYGPGAGADIAALLSSAQMTIRSARAIHQVTAAL